MSEEGKSYVFKIVVVGDGAVGKTSLIKQYTEGNFVKDYIKTIGAQFSKYIDKIEDASVKLFFWDIAGQSEFSFMRPTFYKSAKAVILVYSLIEEQSFNNIKNWYEDIKKFCGTIPIVLFGNKLDLVDEKKLDDSKIENLKKDINLIKYYKTSAKTGENVFSAFRSIIKTLYNSVNKKEIS